MGGLESTEGQGGPSKYGSSTQFFKHMQDVARQEADQIRRKRMSASGEGAGEAENSTGGLRTTGKSRARKATGKKGGSGGTGGAFKM